MLKALLSILPLFFAAIAIGTWAYFDQTMAHIMIVCLYGFCTILWIMFLLMILSVFYFYIRGKVDSLKKSTESK